MPIKEGYIFDGYYDKKNCLGNRYYDSNYPSDWNKDTDTVLYACWKINCPAGFYVQENSDICTKCTERNYCSGGIYNIDKKEYSGITACPSIYSKSEKGSNDIDQCFIDDVPKGKTIVCNDYYLPISLPIYGERPDYSCELTNFCPLDSFCPGGKFYYGDNGVRSCPSEFPNSNINTETEENCFRACKNSDIEHCTAYDKYEDDTQSHFVKPYISYYTKGGINNCRCKTCEEDYILSSDGKKCVYNSIECNSGEYLKKGETLCRPCEEGYYCPKEKKKYKKDDTKDQGINSCPSEYPNSEEGNNDIDSCYKECEIIEHCNKMKGKITKSKNTCVCENCEDGYKKDANECKAKNYIITFDKRGGIGGTDTVNAIFNNPMPQITLPNKTGNSFEGYFDSLSFENKYYNKDGTSVKNWDKSLNSTLYAKYSINKILCNAGEYLPSKKEVCEKCPKDSFCLGGKYPYDEIKDQGIEICPEHYKSDISLGKQSKNQCKISCNSNEYIENEKEVCKTCPEGQVALLGEHYVNYGNTSSCRDIKTNIELLFGGFDSSVSNNKIGEVSATYGQPMPILEHSQLPMRADFEFLGYYSTLDNYSPIKYYDKNGISVRNWDQTIDTAITTTVYKLYGHWASVCKAGKYVKAQEEICSICPSGSYCEGGTYPYNKNLNQGLNNCPDEYPNSKSGNDSINNCFRSCTSSDLENCREFETDGFYTKGGVNNCRCKTCKDGYKLNSGLCSKVLCKEGEYLEGDKCKICENGYTSSGGTTKTCYKTCESNDITGCLQITGTIEKTDGIIKNNCKCINCGNCGISSDGKTCEIKEIICNSGKYLIDRQGCSECMTGYYCEGIRNFCNNFIGDLGYYGMELCPDEYPNSKSGNNSINNCFRSCTSSDLDNCREYETDGFYTKGGINNCRCKICEEDYILSSDGKKCVYNSIECNSGEYLKKGETLCRPCEEGYYCPKEKKKYKKDDTKDQGINSCPSEYPNSEEGNNDIDSCYKECEIIEHCNKMKGKITKSKNTCVCENCEDGYKKDANECKAFEYKIKFICNSGTGEICNKSYNVKYGESLPDIILPIRIGYNFKYFENNSNKFYIESDKNKAYIDNVLDNNYTYKFKTDLVLSAIWGFNKCPENTYLENESCKSCPNGYISDAGSTIISQCKKSCNSGEYLEKGKSTCTKCPSGYYCGGEIYPYNNTKDQGIKSCKDLDPINTYIYSSEKSSSSEQCYLKTLPSKYIKESNGIQENCPENSYCNGNIKVNYGKTGGSNNCPVEYPNSEEGNDSINNCFRSCIISDIENCETIEGNITKGRISNCKCRVCKDDYVLSGDKKKCKSNNIICESGYKINKNTGKCEVCKIAHAVRYSSNNKIECEVEECEEGYHVSIKGCEINKKECEIEGNKGNKYYKEGIWGECELETCKEGYHIEEGKCVNNKRSCDIENGIGEEEYDIKNKTWKGCKVIRCDPGYTKDIYKKNGGEINECGECKNRYERNGEVAVISYIQECEIGSCKGEGSLYRLNNKRDRCEIICIEGEDETGIIRWDSENDRCDIECKEGYTLW